MPPIFSLFLTRVRIVLALLFLGGIFAVAANWYIQRADSKLHPLTISDASLHFGTVWAQSNFNWTFNVENTTSNEIRVRDVAGTCRCIAVAPQSFVVPPNGLTPITLTLDLLPRSSGESAAPLREFSTQLKFELEGTRYPPSIRTLQGAVRNAVDVFPRVLDFGDVAAGADQSYAKLMDVSCFQPVIDFVPLCDSAFVTAHVARPESASERRRLEIRLSPDTPLGEHFAQIQLRPQVSNQTSDTSFLEPAHIPYRVRVNVISDVYASPARLLLGVIPVGHTVQATVVLGTFQNDALEIVEMSTDPAEWIDVIPLPSAGITHPFCVQVRATAPGPQNGMLTFRVKSSRSWSAIRCTVPVVLHGARI